MSFPKIFSFPRWQFSGYPYGDGLHQSLLLIQLWFQAYLICLGIFVDFESIDLIQHTIMQSLLSTLKTWDVEENS